MGGTPMESSREASPVPGHVETSSDGNSALVFRSTVTIDSGDVVRCLKWAEYRGRSVCIKPKLPKKTYVSNQRYQTTDIKHNGL